MTAVTFQSVLALLDYYAITMILKVISSSYWVIFNAVNILIGTGVALLAILHFFVGDHPNQNYTPVYAKKRR